MDADSYDISYSLEQMMRDFTRGVDKPLWPVSSYGSAKAEPNILAELDESPEEMRWKATEALKAGKATDYVCRMAIFDKGLLDSTSFPANI